MIVHSGRTTSAGVALAVSLSLLCAPAGAQQTDSLPFRKGQWGVEFSASDFGGVGALRFTSPKRAWLFDVSARIRNEGGDSDDAAFNRVSDVNDVFARLGYRWYGTLAPRVVRHAGLGLAASRRSSKEQLGGLLSSFPAPIDERADESLGVYAELGAHWMITHNLSLGASWSVFTSVGRSSFVRRTPTQLGTPTREQATTDFFAASIQPIAIRAAVYF